MSAARWGEYRSMLEGALAQGYRALGVEQWLLESAAGESAGAEGRVADGPLLVLRHDVDQHPRSALAMAAVERELGIRSAWYFRWRTADARTVASLREDGCSVGLHYETLSRLALERGARSAAEVAELVPEAR
ncbi:MAG TPA: hypothetical protein VFU04_02825, partial [Solirubrobacterales bacterium]|nr:hypothetical protein [Solirubrobacterales bacterium]